LSQLGNAVVSFALRGERQPWGAEDRAFVLQATFKAAPSDAQKAYDAILAYAHGWLYEEDPLLARPAAALGILNTLTDRDTEVLV